MAPETSRDRKRLPQVHLIGCQGVKLYPPKDCFKLCQKGKATLCCLLVCALPGYMSAIPEMCPGNRRHFGDNTEVSETSLKYQGHQRAVKNTSDLLET